MVTARVTEALFRLLPRDTRLSPRVGLEQLGLFLLLKWLDQRHPGVFLAPMRDSLRWQTWTTRRDLQRAAELGKFVATELLPELRYLAGQDRDKPLAPLFRQENIVHTAFTETAHAALVLINELDLSQEWVRKACAQVYLAELQALGDDMVGALCVPDAICDMAVQWADVKENAVLYDPACASGAFLGRAMATLQDAGHPPAGVVADTTESQALFVTVLAVLETGMPFHARLPKLSHGVHMQSEDACRRPHFEADVIFTNPPFGFGRDLTGKRTKADELQPVRLEGVFLARSLAALKPAGGRMAIILPDGCLSSTQRTMVELRSQLLDDCRVVCVISLPTGLYARSAAKTSLLFVERTGKTTDEILYCELPPEALGTPALMHDLCGAVVELCRQWQGGSLPGTDPDGLTWWTMKADTCREQSYNLAPHKPLPPIEASDVERPREVIKRLLSATRELEQVLRNLQRALPGGEGMRR